MAIPFRFTYILPAKNEAQTLPRTLIRLGERLREFPGSRIFVVVNGSTDDTFAVGLAHREHRISILQSDRVGIGAGYAMGIEAATSSSLSDAEWIVLSAADLPFGFSDLEAVCDRLRSDEISGERIFVGSKAHAESQLEYPWLRKRLSFLYSLLRRLILRFPLGDSQGTIFVSTQLAQSLLRQTRSRDFFFSTELLYRAYHRGNVKIEEVPVQMERMLRKSSVRLFRDGFSMLGQMFHLARRGS